jgi:hypothetical protein
MVVFAAVEELVAFSPLLGLWLSKYFHLKVLI